MKKNITHLTQQVSCVEAGPDFVVIDHIDIFILLLYVSHQGNVSYNVPIV